VGPDAPGDVPLELVVVPPGVDPLTRAAWTFRPLVTRVNVGLPAPPDPAWTALAPLARATLLACGLVALGGAFFR
jgi:hypothetical protein